MTIPEWLDNSTPSLSGRYVASQNRKWRLSQNEDATLDESMLELTDFEKPKK